MAVNTDLFQVNQQVFTALRPSWFVYYGAESPKPFPSASIFNAVSSPVWTRNIPSYLYRTDFQLPRITAPASAWHGAISEPVRIQNLSYLYLPLWNIRVGLAGQPTAPAIVGVFGDFKLMVEYFASAFSLTASHKGQWLETGGIRSIQVIK